MNRKLPRKGAVADEHADMVHADCRYRLGFRRCRNFVNLREHCSTLALPATHLIDRTVLGQWPFLVILDRPCGFRLPFDVCSSPKPTSLLRGNEMVRRAQADATGCAISK